MGALDKSYFYTNGVATPLAEALAPVGEGYTSKSYTNKVCTAKPCLNKAYFPSLNGICLSCWVRENKAPHLTYGFRKRATWQNTKPIIAPAKPAKKEKAPRLIHTSLRRRKKH